MRNNNNSGNFQGQIKSFAKQIHGIYDCSIYKITSGYLLSETWLIKWKKFINYDEIKNKKNISKVEDNLMNMNFSFSNSPGKITNDDIYQYSLINDKYLIRNKSFIIIPINLWKNFKNIFQLNTNNDEIEVDRNKDIGYELIINNINTIYSNPDIYKLFSYYNKGYNQIYFLEKKVINIVKNDIISLFENKHDCKINNFINRLSLKDSSITLDNISVSIDYKNEIIDCKIKNNGNLAIFKEILALAKSINSMKLENGKEVIIISRTWFENWKKSIKFIQIKDVKTPKEVSLIHNNIVPKIAPIENKEIFLDFNSFFNNMDEEDINNYIFLPNQAVLIDKNIAERLIKNYSIDYIFSVKYSKELFNKKLSTIYFYKNNEKIYECDSYFPYTSEMDFKNKFLAILNNNNNKNEIKEEIKQIFHLKTPISIEDFYIEYRNKTDEFSVTFVNDEVKRKIKNEIYLLYLDDTKMIQVKNKCAINKKWLENWKKLVNYETNKNILNKNKNKPNPIEYIILPNKELNFEKINNSQLFLDFDKFLNDGDSSNDENYILKDDSFEIISSELWESFEYYGYDKKIGDKIIKNKDNMKRINLTFFYDGGKNQQTIPIFINTNKYSLEKEKYIMNVLIKCLNSKTKLSDNICSRVKIITKFEEQNIILNDIPGKNEYLVSFSHNKYD